MPNRRIDSTKSAIAMGSGLYQNANARNMLKIQSVRGLIVNTGAGRGWRESARCMRRTIAPKREVEALGPIAAKRINKCCMHGAAAHRSCSGRGLRNECVGKTPWGPDRHDAERGEQGEVRLDRVRAERPLPSLY